MARNSASPRETGFREWWYAFDPRYSLRARAAFIVGGAAFLFVLLITWLAGNIFRRSLESQLGPMFEAFAFQVGDKIDRSIYERRHQLEFLVNLPAFRTAPTGPTGAAQRRQLLETLQKESPDWAWIGFIDPFGNVVSGTEGRFEGISVALRPWFRGARDNSYAGGPREIPELPRGVSLANDETPGRFLDLAVPVPASDAGPPGVLAAHVRWSWAGEVARSVLNEAAVRNQIGVTIYAGSTEVLFDSGASGWTVPPNAPSVSNPRTFRGFFTESFPFGSPYLTGFARTRGFREYRGLGLMVAVRQPVDRAFAPVRELQDAVVRWGLAFAASLTVGAWFFVTPVVRRMKGIRSAAIRIRTGDILTVMPSHRGETEMSDMCEALGHLVEDFREKLPKPPPDAGPSPETGTVPPPGAPPEKSAGDYVKPTGADPRRVVW